MRDIRIERLALKVSGLTEAECRRLAVRIAQGIGDADLPLGSAPRVDSVAVRAAGVPGQSIESLSRLAIEQVLAHMRRSA